MWSRFIANQNHMNDVSFESDPIAILYHSLVKRSNTSAFHADGTGSNPVGVTICPLLLIG